ncbi:MAG: hypothetical protein L3K05_06955 [Thermoplasmata archaeon]|nr:hypothetical protein [Thermoplasmata archaeon]
MSPGHLARALGGVAPARFAAPLPALLAAGSTDLQQTSPLVWVMVAVSVAGALITYAFLAYAIWRYRDPHTRGRRYG